MEVKFQRLLQRLLNTLNPSLITLDLITNKINKWKEENHIYSQEITHDECKEIPLSFSNILQISNLDNLLSLEVLRLDNNMIMKIENLDKLVNIKWLDLSFNYIDKIEGLSKLVNLTDLSLFSNLITTVEGLDDHITVTPTLAYKAGSGHAEKAFWHNALDPVAEPAEGHKTYAGNIAFAAGATNDVDVEIKLSFAFIH